MWSWMGYGEAPSGTTPMPDCHRIVIEVLRWACVRGAVALNHMRVTDLLHRGQQVHGVVARDALSGTDHEFRARVVINATGPDCRRFAAIHDHDHPALFRDSLAWNLLFHRPAISTHALAVTPPYPRARTYFIHPWKNRRIIYALRR